MDEEKCGSWLWKLGRLNQVVLFYIIGNDHRENQIQRLFNSRLSFRSAWETIEAEHQIVASSLQNLYFFLLNKAISEIHL